MHRYQNRLLSWRSLACRWGVLFSACGWILPPAIAASPPASPCPNEFEPFISEMLTQLPAYINRVNTRAGNRKNYAILASQAEFEPLPLGQGASYQSAPAGVRQVFFSILLKRFSLQRIVHHQDHHWLLMAPSDRGWEFVQMYSTLSSYPTNSIMSAPRNSSEGSVATAIKDWLKTCHYRVKP